MANKGRKRPSPKRSQPGRRPSPASSKAGAKPQAGKSQPGKSRSGEKRPTRAERLESARQARRRKALAVRAAIGGIAALLVGGLVVRALGGGDGEADAVRSQLTAGSCSFDTRADPTDAGNRSHVANPTYEVQPPAGGNHSPQAARPAVYREGQVPTDGQVVHAMEHGDVVLWHRPGLAPEELDALRRVSDTYERDVLVVPRPELSTKVAATAWGKRLLCNELEPPALDLFTRTYRDQGPEQFPE